MRLTGKIAAAGILAAAGQLGIAASTWAESFQLAELNPEPVRASPPGDLRSVIERLRHWSDCIELAIGSPPLCPPEGGAIEIYVDSIVMTLLKTHPKDKRALCTFDYMIVRSQSECFPRTSDSQNELSHAFHLASLMTELARNWVRFGALDRAGQLFRQANDLIAATASDSSIILAAFMRPWIEFEIAQGRLWQAGQLARRQTVMIRRIHDTYPDVPELIRDLSDALSFEAGILRQLGQIEEARNKLREASSLVKSLR